jgi:hypothetical protein
MCESVLFLCSIYALTRYSHGQTHSYGFTIGLGLTGGAFFMAGGTLGEYPKGFGAGFSTNLY